ncbi:MAG: transposase [Verrucomicrobiaceae bacterium]|nr:transposase [Verrucomicrobiaceae bacterium]
MPRAPRIQYENAVYHVMARGDRHELIFLDDEDRWTFLRTLAGACRRTGWEVFAWVLMNNHYHLAFRTPQANLVEGMTWLQNTYTRRFNVRHGLWGHLFGGRYKAIPVEAETAVGSRRRCDYLTTLIDYIHLNPARAGLVDGRDRSLLDYPWSSLSQAYAKPPAKRAKWMVTAEGLDLCGESDTAKGRRRLVERLDRWASEEESERAGLVHFEEQSLQSALRRGWYWGSQGFRESLLERFGASAKARRNRDDRSSPMLKDHALADAERIVAEACEHFGIDEAVLRSRSRGDHMKAAVAWAIWCRTTQSQDWIAGRLNLRSRANVSQTVRRFEATVERDLPDKVREWKKTKVVD